MQNMMGKMLENVKEYNDCSEKQKESVLHVKYSIWKWENEAAFE